MPHRELYATRSSAYSRAHRFDSVRRYVDDETARKMSMIDIDGVLFDEYDDGTKRSLVLIESALDVGQSYKAATVTLDLAPAGQIWPDGCNLELR